MDDAFTRQLLGEISQHRSDASMVLWCCYFTLADACDSVAPPHSYGRNGALKCLHTLQQEVQTLAQERFIKRDSQAGKAAALHLTPRERRHIAYGSHLMDQFSAIPPIRETLWGPVDATGRRKWNGGDPDAHASRTSR